MSSSISIRRRSYSSLALALLVLFICSALPQSLLAQTKNEQRAPRGWKLVWADEFDGPDGSAPDAAKWNVANSGKWANNELQYYTARPENVRVENGALVITARREHYTGESDGLSRDFTSGRINTDGKFSQEYGRFEARIKLPHTQGMWPAFWLLGDNKGKVDWPECGEIDIMELVGSKPSTVLGTIHGPGHSGSGGISAYFNLPKGKQFSDDFHVFATEWEKNVVRFYVDGKLYGKVTPRDLPKNARWVYDHPFNVILNLAVGGNLPGNPDDTTEFPQQMVVDYVKVYSR